MSDEDISAECRDPKGSKALTTKLINDGANLCVKYPKKIILFIIIDLLLVILLALAPKKIIIFFLIRHLLILY